LARDKDLIEKKILASKDFDDQRALVTQLEAAVKADQAAVDNARVQLSYTRVTSPIDGRTGIRLVDQGNLVHANDLTGLVVLTQLRPIAVIFTLPEQNLPQIQDEAAKGELEVLAMDRDNTTVLGTGRLAVVDNQIDTTTGTIKIKAIFKNEDLRLWPGQFVNARLHVLTRKDSIVVPATVVQRGPDGSFAFVINETNGVAMRPVKVARIQDGIALIERGLSPGENVVVDGQYKLQNGSKVKPSQAETADGGGSEKRGGRARGDGTSKRPSGDSN
jgi:multidrug efflux system membrane fusion protein